MTNLDTDNMDAQDVNGGAILRLECKTLVEWKGRTPIEQRDSDRLGCSQQTQHHCYQVIRTTRVHQSSRSSRMVSVQEKVIRSRLQLGYSTPTSFINRVIDVDIDVDVDVDVDVGVGVGVGVAETR
ncbi:hypothetical protein HZH66_009732 [Vespula vulgaris]|uniref:Uncharacterized protein n=1 Tax=Vespula vulgaris TaxID=7454 RepID=A0A834JN95_VESVU|nr:hypothetical protein HZH66_009732 [Vespula vulgaris]